MKQISEVLRALLKNIREGNAHSHELLSDWLEERGVSYRLTGEERWEAVWLWQNYREPCPNESCQTGKPATETCPLCDNAGLVPVDWSSLLNAPEFEAQPFARAEKLLLAQWWDEQLEDCWKCVDRSNCPFCEGEGKLPDSRRAAGMRWLVENDCKPQSQSDRFNWPKEKLPQKVFIQLSPVYMKRYGAYFWAAKGVGQWLEANEKIKPKT